MISKNKIKQNIKINLCNKSGCLWQKMKMGASNSGSSFWMIVGYTVPQSHQDNYAAASIVALCFASNNYHALFKNFQIYDVTLSEPVISQYPSRATIYTKIQLRN